jgi:uncharacterized protein YqhQ
VWKGSSGNTQRRPKGDAILIFRYFKHFVLTATSWALGSSDDVLVGGQAVIEGVMMRSPKGYSVAVRRQDGSIRVIKELLKTPGEKRKLFKLPIFRGVGVLGQALVLGIKALRFSAEEAILDDAPAGSPSEAKAAEKKAAEAKTEEQPAEPKKLSSWLIAGNIVLALGVNVALFIALPLFITSFIQSRVGFESTVAFNAIDGVFRVGTFVCFLLMVSWMKDMRRVFEYHGAEHKTVYNFEAKEDLTIDNARKYSTLHPRCGTSFLLVLMIVSILVFSLAHFESIGAKLLSRIVLLPLIAGISYEIIRFSAKHPRSLMRAVTYPGLLLQKITTKEPDEKQLATAIRALEEALSV